MIALSSDCLIFKMEDGQSMPCSADMIAIEMAGQGTSDFDEEFVQQAANAVFHYYKHEKGQLSVTVGEFAGSLEKVLQGFALQASPVSPPLSTQSRDGVVFSDLRRIARESGRGCELIFFPRLREELRRNLAIGTRMLHLGGLRSCVKHLLGAQRRSQRCRELEEQIVHFVRECLTVERTVQMAVLVD